MRRKALLALSAISLATAQQYNITTIAGGGGANVGQMALNTTLAYPSGVWVDAAGNLYVSTACQVLVMNSSGVVTQIIGKGSCGFSGDGGPATSAELNEVNGIAGDAGGTIYIADGYNNRIRKVSGGIITTFAGTGSYTISGDGGSPTDAGVSQPTAVALDGAANLYIADEGNNVIRKVSTLNSYDGRIVANAAIVPAGIGGAISVSVNDPTDLLFDINGYFAK